MCYNTSNALIAGRCGVAHRIKAETTLWAFLHATLQRDTRVVSPKGAMAKWRRSWQHDTLDFG